MRSFFLFGFSMFFLAVWSSCDKVDDPYEGVDTGSVDTAQCPVPLFSTNTNTYKKILLEEYTGQGCGNCPGGALIAKDLYNQYPEQIILMSVHAGYFADIGPSGGNEYGSDYRTTAGEEYNSTYGNDLKGNPNGMVNRVASQGDVVASPGDWSTLVHQIKDDAPALNLQIVTEYDSTDRTVCIHVETEVLQALTGDYKLVVCLTEDNITDWQKNYAGTGDPSYPTGSVETYLHRHVLRDNVNGTWGTEVISSSAAAGEKFINSLTYSLDSDWDEQECDIVAYVYNATDVNDPQTYEILQVAEEAVTE